MELLQEVSRLQDKVKTTVVALGGYWRPLSALARVLEELGEVGELLVKDDVQTDELGNELADVFVITTCLANQYCCNLRAAYKEFCPGVPRADPHSNFHNLVHRSGKLARIINIYEGDKPLKRDDVAESVAREIALIHYQLNEIASSFNCCIMGAVDQVLDRSVVRDRNRFASRWDPTTSNAIATFQSIVESTGCIFAKQAKLWGAPDYDQTLSIHENVNEIAAVLARFCKIAPREKLDGFVIQLTTTDYISSINAFSTAFNAMLRGLGEASCGYGWDNAMNHDLLSPKWRYTFCGVSFFITTFAPFYRKSHPRWSPISNAAFILMQPEESFDHHGIHKHNRKRNSIKESIRKKFDAISDGYSEELVEQPIEAFKYIKPLDKYGDPVKWWLTA